MFNRIMREHVDIVRPFQLPGLARVYPAGLYEVTTEQELLGDTMSPVYRRVSTTIYLPRQPGEVGLGEFYEIEPVELARLTDNSFDRGSTGDPT